MSLKQEKTGMADETEHRHKTDRELLEDGLKAVFGVAVDANIGEEGRKNLDVAADTIRQVFARAMETIEGLEKSVMSDPLTGVPNRAGIMHDLEKRIENARRLEHQLAVVFIDLDGFKDVNDQCGHAAGDDALIKTADRFTSAFRKADTVGRLGGDEMVLLLSYEDSTQFSEDIVKDKVREALDGLVYWHGKTPFPIGASIGLATLDDLQHAEEGAFETLWRSGEAKSVADVMVKVADKAMYADKAGKAERLAAAREKALDNTGNAPEKTSPSRSL